MSNKRATISADIISSTSLTSVEMAALHQTINSTFVLIEKELANKNESFWGRIVKGDAIECVFDSPRYALRSALLLKSAVLLASSSWEQGNEEGLSEKGMAYFKSYGLRMAIGVGEMRTVDKARGIIDGDAIYKSGRKIASYSTSGKERIRIKNTLFYVSDDPRENRIMEALLSFADVLYKKATPKQMQVLYYKLQGKTDADIAEALGYRISTINKHGLLLGWNAIAEMLDLYENTLFAK